MPPPKDLVMRGNKVTRRGRQPPATGLKMKTDGLQKMRRAREQAAKRQSVAEEAFARQAMKGMDVQQLLLDKIEQRTKGGAYNLMRAFRVFDTSSGDDAAIDYKEFKDCLERFGLAGIPDLQTREMFRAYDTSNDGKINFQEFVKGVMKAHSDHNSINLAGNDLQEKARARELQRQNEMQAKRNKTNTISVDVEQLLLEKIEQRTSGGPYNLFKAFRKFDTTSADQASIDYDDFRTCLHKFGMDGVSDADMRKLFKKYDKDGGGQISFDEFVKGVMKSHSDQNSISMQETGVAQMDKARQVSENRRLQAQRRHWNTLNVDVEKVLLTKIEQRTRGGPHQLRRAFRHFDLGSGSPEISYEEFKSGLLSFGLHELPEDDCKDLFNRYDVSNDGVINFDEFVSGVMQSGAPAPEDDEDERERLRAHVLFGDRKKLRREARRRERELRNQLAEARKSRGIPGLGLEGSSKGQITTDPDVRRLLDIEGDEEKTLPIALRTDSTPGKKSQLKPLFAKTSPIKRGKKTLKRQPYLRRSASSTRTMSGPPQNSLRRAVSSSRLRSAGPGGRIASLSRNSYNGPTIVSTNKNDSGLSRPRTAAPYF